MIEFAAGAIDDAVEDNALEDDDDGSKDYAGITPMHLGGRPVELHPIGSDAGEEGGMGEAEIAESGLTNLGFSTARNSTFCASRQQQRGNK